MCGQALHHHIKRAISLCRQFTWVFLGPVCHALGCKISGASNVRLLGQQQMFEESIDLFHVLRLVAQMDDERFSLHVEIGQVCSTRIWPRENIRLCFSEASAEKDWCDDSVEPAVK